MAAGTVCGTAVAGVVGGVVPIGRSASGERVAFTLGLMEKGTSDTFSASDVVVPDVACVVLAKSAVSGACGAGVVGVVEVASVAAD